MQEVVKNDIETFLQQTLFYTMIPVLSAMFIFIYILNLNSFFSIILAILVVYLLDTDTCKYYSNRKNKLLFIKNILIILILFSIIIFITNKEITLTKIIFNVLIVLIETQLLLNNILIKNKKDFR